MSGAAEWVLEAQCRCCLPFCFQIERMLAEKLVVVNDGKLHVLNETELRDIETSGLKGIITSQIGTRV